MSWLRNVINYKKIKSGEFYTAVDPADFYEWKFSSSIPKGTIFTSYLPESDTFTKGYIIASIRPDNSFLSSKGEGEFELNQDSPLDVNVLIGSMDSPAEVLNKVIKIKEKFAKDFNAFKNTCLSQKYVLHDKNPIHLYKLEKEDEDSVKVTDYGSLTDIHQELNKIKNSIAIETFQKKGRAHEMEISRRIENIVLLLNNKNMPVDPVKIDYVFKIAKLKPIKHYTSNWNDCYMQLSDEGEKNQAKIAGLSSLKWVQAGLQLIQ